MTVQTTITKICPDTEQLLRAFVAEKLPKAELIIDKENESEIYFQFNSEMPRDFVKLGMFIMSYYSRHQPIQICQS